MEDHAKTKWREEERKEGAIPAPMVVEEGDIWLDSYVRLPLWLRCRLNYFRLHVCYFLLVGLVGSLVIYTLEHHR